MLEVTVDFTQIIATYHAEQHRNAFIAPNSLLAARVLNHFHCFDVSLANCCQTLSLRIHENVAV